MTRIVALEGVRNFRDFGGYAARGGQLKRAKLYRSAHHADATDSDLQTIAGLGVSLIVNLLRPAERDRFPSRRWSDFSAATIHNDEEHEGDESWSDFLKQSDLSAASFRGHLQRFYRSACFAPRHI